MATLWGTPASLLSRAMEKSWPAGAARHLVLNWIPWAVILSEVPLGVHGGLAVVLGAAPVVLAAVGREVEVDPATVTIATAVVDVVDVGPVVFPAASDGFLAGLLPPQPARPHPASSRQ